MFARRPSFPPRLLTALLAATLVALPASRLEAQWQDASSGGYWNNSSSDGTNCNIGYILRNTEGSCNNQEPAGWLSSSGELIAADAKVLQSAGAPLRFYFGAGTWEIDLLGRVAGADVPSESQFGYQLIDDFDTQVAINGSTMLTAEFGFYLWLDAWNPNTDPRRFYSDMVTFGIDDYVAAPQQFAVFTDAANSGGTVEKGPDFLGTFYELSNTGTYFVGGEDNACDAVPGIGGCAFGYPNNRNSFSDRDYNDFVIRVKAVSVPEPALPALLAAGLLAMLARRSRQLRAMGLRVWES